MLIRSFPISSRILSAAVAAALSCWVVAQVPAAEERELRSFEKITLHDQFWSEGAGFGDFNHDGKQDVVAGPFWWEGPAFQKRHEYAPADKTFDLKLGPITTVKVPGFHGALGKENFYSENFFAFSRDFNADGWADILIIGFPGKDTSWYENPRGEEKHWARHKIFDQTDNESPTFTDITGDDKPELVCITKGAYGYASPDWSDAAKPWAWHPISPVKGYGNFTHGMGLGDLNGDGRVDLLEKDGWWEQPASLAGDPFWTHHPVSLGSGGAQMYAYDVDGDGLNDVITSLEAHGFGLAWFRQTREGQEIKLEKRIIVGREPRESRYGVKFSEPHAIDLVDMDGDGLKDIVTGKRFWSHGRTGDPDRNMAAVIYWFKLVRGADRSVDFVPYLIDSDSGVGTQVVATDLNADGLPDVVVGNKKGAFVLLQTKKNVSLDEWQKAQPKLLEPAPPAGGGAGGGSGGGSGASASAVDLRPNFERWNLAQRRQGRRNTCSVFATVGAMEYALARNQQRGTALSVEFLNWAGNHVTGRPKQDGHFFSEVIRGYELHGICPEEEMPYTARMDAANQPTAKARESALALKDRALKFHWIRPNDHTKGITARHIEETKAVLKSGWPVAAGSYHSLLFVGFEDDPALPGGGRFLVRDSGGGREQAMTYEAAAKRICDLFWVEMPA